MAITVLEQENNLDELVKDDKKVIIDFFAEWCGPCKMLAPVLHNISDELGEDVDIIKVDIDKHEEIAAKYDVQAVPTLVFVKDGKVNNTEVGFMSKQAILDMLNK